VKSPFFTVIIPTFNRSDKLQHCLNSVLSQTFTNFEILIIDNGSTDNIRKMIPENFKDSRIHYFWQKGSGSPANPRNQGIRKSRGVWVAFLDSDDVWYPEKLEIVYNKIQAHSETDVICHNERMCDQMNQKTHNISHV
jgi:glycosyltransferase involved in cell wall biosynthesis